MCDTRLPATRRRGVHGGVVLATPRGDRASSQSSSATRRWPLSARVAVAPLPEGHGVRGWLMVGRPASGERGLTDERLRLLEGLSYRAAMALQKARLARHREQSLHVADALLDVRPRARTQTRDDDVEERIVRLAAEMLEAKEVSLWLQAAPGAEIARRCGPGRRRGPSRARACSQLPGRGRTAVLRAARAVRAPPRAVRGDPRRRPSSAAEETSPLRLSRSTRAGWASSSPALADGETFGELQLKMLAGLADQAKLAVSRSR